MNIIELNQNELLVISGGIDITAEGIGRVIGGIVGLYVGMIVLAATASSPIILIMGYLGLKCGEMLGGLVVKKLAA